MPLITLLDYLQIVGNKGGTGCLKVSGGDGRIGEIFLEDGEIVFASVPDMTSGLHTVAVMSVWEPVTVEWQEDARPPVRPFRAAVPEVLMRMAVLVDEGAGGMKQLKQELCSVGHAGAARGSRRCHWCLELVNTARQGLRFALDKPEVRVGRGRGNDITILHPSISRSHCMFVVTGDRLRVLDLGSSNGTIVDGKPVTEEVLTSGAEVRLGKCRFRLAYEECDIDRPTTPVLVLGSEGKATAKTPVPEGLGEAG
ncbi:MAG: FHA domain-containing protein [Verrucomicrobiae bacterium]|nr:FHA domain-containing protein [Verrucomicrobiae bacterium]